MKKILLPLILSLFANAIELKLGTHIGILQRWRRDLTLQDIQLLGKSKIQNFETNFWDIRLQDVELRRAFIQMAKDTGKKVQSCHLPFGSEYDISLANEEKRKAAIRNLQPFIAVSEEYGCEYLTIHASYEDMDVDTASPERQARLASLRKSLKEMIPLIGKMKLGIELCGGCCLGNTSKELLQIVDGMPECIGIVVDTNHGVGNTPRDTPQYAIRQVASRLLGLHISDNDGNGKEEKHWMPGEGAIDFDEIKKVLEDINYQGYITYEALIPGDTLAERIEELEHNFNFIFLEK